jgi:kinesin family protein 2/24
LLRLPVPEFLTRCLRTPDVTQEQATAFQAKFWRLHVDSSRSGSTKPSTAPKSETTAVEVDAEDEYKGLSSHDARPGMTDVPFKERIRPGMIVSWNPPDDTPGYYRLPGRNLIMVMAPEKSSGHEEPGDQATYRCSAVIPAVMPGAFEVYLWQQVIVPVSTIEAEVLLEYDVATRYYYETV